MILSEASKKYGMPLDRLCRAVSAAGVEPTGYRQGQRRMLKEYAEKEIVDAILAEYKRRFLVEKRKADHWKVKASEAITIFRNSQPIVEDDL